MLFIMYVVVFVEDAALSSVFFFAPVFCGKIRRMFLLVVFQQNPTFPAVMILSKTWCVR